MLNNTVLGGCKIDPYCKKVGNVCLYKPCNEITEEIKALYCDENNKTRKCPEFRIEKIKKSSRKKIKSKLSKKKKSLWLSFLLWL